MGQRAPGTRDTGRYDLAAYQRHNLRREALETLNALGDRLSAKIEDQLVHADRREGADVTSDVIRSPEKGRRDPSGDGMPVSYNGAL